MILKILEDDAISPAFLLKFNDIAAIRCPAALTGTTLTLLGGISADTNAMVPIHGSEFPAVTGKIVIITTRLRGIPYIAIQSNGTEAADREFYLYLE